MNDDITRLRAAVLTHSHVDVWSPGAADVMLTAMARKKHEKARPNWRTWLVLLFFRP